MIYNIHNSSFYPPFFAIIISIPSIIIPFFAQGRITKYFKQSTSFHYRLFEENEELIRLFEKFSELRTKEEQATSVELAEHATKVMRTLDESIKNLKDIDSFYAYIRHVGATHHQVPGFKADNFWKIEQPFLQAAKTTLGERYTPNIESIYKLTIRFILENLVKGYEDAGKQNGNGQT
ncbi:hypothetical protein ACJJTC_002845 [Scirpophaga incertulas]